MARDMTPLELEHGLQDAANEARLLGEEYAEKRGKAESTKDRRDDYLASLKAAVEIPEGEKDTNAYRENLARLTPQWIAFREELSAMQAEVLKLKIQYEVACRRWETYRSLLSSKNTERRTAT